MTTAMRTTGLVDDVAKLGLHDHVCWVYEDRAEFRKSLVDFLVDGLELGLHVQYVGAGSRNSLLEDLEGLGDAEDLLGRGVLQISSFADMYDCDSVLDPAATERVFAEATAAALAAGYRGLRAAADSTSLVETAEQLDAFARWEHLADRLMVRRPLSALCGFSRQELGDDAVAALACMHPIARTGSTPFRVHASGDADVAIAGEIDIWAQEGLERALERAELGPGSHEIVFDGGTLEFLDHRALFLLRDHASRLGATAVLRTNHPLAGRLVELLEIEGLRIQREAPPTPYLS